MLPKPARRKMRGPAGLIQIKGRPSPSASWRDGRLTIWFCLSLVWLMSILVGASYFLG
jgi:hypothetical protein